MEQVTPAPVETKVTPATVETPVVPQKKGSGVLKVVIIMLVVLFGCCVVTVVAGIAIWPSISKNIVITNDSVNDFLPDNDSEYLNLLDPKTDDKKSKLTDGGIFKLGKPEQDNTILYDLVTVNSPQSDLLLNDDIDAGAAQDNVIYYAEYLNTPVLVYGFNNGLTTFKYMVELGRGQCSSGEETDIAFSDLAYPVAIAQGMPIDNIYINNACLSEDGTSIFYSLISDAAVGESAINLVLHYSITAEGTLVLLEKPLNFVDSYYFESFNGQVYLDEIIGNYLFASEGLCYSCDTADHVNFVIDYSQNKVLYLGEWLTDFEVEGVGHGSAAVLEVVGEDPECMMGDCDIREPGDRIDFNLP